MYLKLYVFGVELMEYYEMTKTFFVNLSKSAFKNYIFEP
ncbi:hypothetical protein VCHE40_2528 [Vibrio cholerae HE-40]|nr:hypothetical protein VCHE39_3221 [Vibrio cholerae HE39]EKL27707.1 hypothetical protein VCHE40_2528 [Vibrio cholerae HE-40]EKL34373.1 hypothetical protein VCHE46_2539 [Vibrio cholerae HE-46]